MYRFKLGPILFLQVYYKVENSDVTLNDVIIIAVTLQTERTKTGGRCFKSHRTAPCQICVMYAPL